MHPLVEQTINELTTQPSNESVVARLQERLNEKTVAIAQLETERQEIENALNEVTMPVTTPTTETEQVADTDESVDDEPVSQG